MAGVHVVLTAADVPGAATYGLECRDQPVLAADVVRFMGEPVAVVAADHPETARRAAAAIRVDYEPLAPLVDVLRAADADPIHPDGNVFRHLDIRHGDLDATGPVVVEGTYDVGMQDQAPLGTEAGLAIPAERRWRRPVRVHPGAAQRPRPGLGLPRPAARARADPAGRRGRGVRRPRGREPADPRGARSPCGPVGR